MDANDNFGSEILHFIEKVEVLELIDGLCLSDKHFDDRFTSLAKILNKYQEQSQLLGPHLNEMLDPLNIALVKVISDEKDYDNKIHGLCKVIQLISRVRGPKHILKYFPHETRHLELCWNALLKQNRADYDNWETRYILWLWLSVLCLIPFDISSIDSLVNYDSSLVATIVALAKLYLSDPGPSRESAALCLSSLLTRPDMEATYLHDFLMWCSIILTKTEVGIATPESFQIVGVLTSLAQIFKTGHRNQLLTYAPVILVPCLSFTSMLNDTLCCKLMCKLYQRIALTFLPPRIAEWRYTRGNRTMVLRNSSIVADKIENFTCVFSEVTEDIPYVPVEMESILDKIFDFLCDKDTVVRWSAAKGIGRITMLLPKSFASDVIAAVMEMFEDDDADSNWHGGCLALAELSRRGLLLPEHLVSVVPFIVRAIVFDVVRGQHSIGSHVRDAACYVCWSFSRAYAPMIMRDYTDSLSASMMITTLFDREIACRRAACAAFQENAGRQGSENFPTGIDIITIADYFSVGNRNASYLSIAPSIGKLDKRLNIALLRHLCEVKIYHWDANVRSLSSKAVVRLFILDIETHIALINPILSNCLSVKFNVRHGALITLAELFLALSIQNYSLSSSLMGDIISVVAKLEKARLYRGKGGELVRQAVCFLIESIAKSSLVVPMSVQLSYIESLNEHLVQPFESLQRAAVDALRQVLFTYFPSKLSDQEKFRKITIYKYLNDLNTTENVAVARGSALAIGSLNPLVYTQTSVVIDFVLESLSRAVSSSKAFAGEYDAETSRNSIEALTELVERAVEFSTFSISHVQRVIDVLFESCENYRIDKRGDVGSWSRNAALSGLERTFNAVLSKERASTSYITVAHTDVCVNQVVMTGYGAGIVKEITNFSSKTLVRVVFPQQSLGDSFVNRLNTDYLTDDFLILISGQVLRKAVPRNNNQHMIVSSVVSREIVEQTFCAVLKQLSEKLDLVRIVAGGVLTRLLESVGCRLKSSDLVILSTAIDSVLTVDNLSINWTQPEHVFTVVTLAMKSKRFFYSTLSGLIVSVGGMTETISKVSSGRLVQFLVNSNDNGEYISLAKVSLLQLFIAYSGNDRVMCPLLKTTEFLLIKCVLTPHLDSNNNRIFLEKLLKFVCKEVKGSSNVAKICSCLNILAILMQLDGGLTRYCALKFLINYLGHKYSAVRAYCAKTLYEHSISDAFIVGCSFVDSSVAETFGVFATSEDCDAAVDILNSTPWISEDKDIISVNKSLIMSLCRLNNTNSVSNMSDLKTINKLFSSKAKSTSKITKKVIDELDSYESLVREAGY